MGRALAVLVLVCLLLPSYMWFATQLSVGVIESTGHNGLAPLAVAMPYQLLNNSEAPPLEELSGLRVNDTTRLIDLHDFRWLLGGHAACREIGNGRSPLVLVLVHTATDHKEHRQLIRETWGSWNSNDLLVRFLVGQPTTSAEQHALEEEAEAFGDVVQGSFVDAYRNLTYKHAMALKWFATRCPEALYVLKVDDDVLVNTPVLLDFVRHSLSPFGARHLLACTVLTGARVKRTWRSKWRVSWREYDRLQYPTYCTGWAVLYSPDVAMMLYREVQNERYFWIDDVLVTGSIPERLGLTHVTWNSLTMAPGDTARILAGQQNPSFMLALWNDVDMDMMTQRLVWQHIVEQVNSSNATSANNADRDKDKLIPVSN